MRPLFFILSVNDCMTDDTMASYADETAIISNSWESAYNTINELFCNVDNCLAENKLSSNRSKTVYITFGNHCDTVPKRLDVKICDNYLQRVHNHKYLGLTFDCHMRRETHVECIVKKSNSLYLFLLNLLLLLFIAALLFISQLLYL